MPRGPKNLDALAARLGYTFNDPKLLKLALTHSSVRERDPHTGDNERLEFVGDRVLGLAIAEHLWREHPDLSEGLLAHRLNRLVRKETCAEVAKDQLDLGRFIRLSRGEADSGGRDKTTIVGDACEALLGAIFLDGGYPAARDAVYRLWEPWLRGEGPAHRDAKSALQEWAQGRGLALPQYREISRSGPDHAPWFAIRVEVDGVSAAIGEGDSKRVAEQAAAAAMLVREGVWDEALDH